MTDIEARRAARRKAMPVVTALVESLEAEGLQPKVIFAQENGITVGHRPEYREVFDIPKGYRIMQEVKRATRR